MNTEEYEKALVECWNGLRAGVISKHTLPREKYVHDCAFDYAYRLGMEAAKKEQQKETQKKTKENADTFASDNKHFDNIVKDGFRNERRLNIATRILCAIIPMFDNKYGESELTKDGEQTIVRNSFRLADMMIEESEKKGGKK